KLSAWQCPAKVVLLEYNTFFDTGASRVFSRVAKRRRGNVRCCDCPTITCQPDGIVALAASQLEGVAGRKLLRKPLKHHAGLAAGCWLSGAIDVFPNLFSSLVHIDLLHSHRRTSPALSKMID